MRSWKTSKRVCGATQPSQVDGRGWMAETLWSSWAPERSDRELLDEGSGDDDAAIDHPLDLQREVVDDEQIGDLGEDQHAEERADDGATAAGEGGAADDRRGDRVELVEVAVGVA